jgi:hypothetical protein
MKLSAPPETESRLLIACARTQLDVRCIANINDMLAGELDWGRVLVMAERHRVRPLLFAALSKVDGGRVPPAILARLRSFAAANALRALFLTGELFSLLDLLQSHGIAAAPFKGPTLAILVYGSAGVREAGDLDVLVRRDDIIRARKLLLDRDSHPAYPTASPAEIAWLGSLTGRHEQAYLLDHCEHHLVRAKDAVNVDLHWDLAIRQFALPLGQHELWNWLTPQSIKGRPVLTFGAEELLIVLCINGAKDCWRRLDRICDIAELIRSHPALNWSRVFSEARNNGAMRMLGVGLTLAADILGAQLGNDARNTLAGDRAVAALALRVRRDLFTDFHDDVESAGIGKSLFHLSSRERLGDKLRFVLAQLRPTIGDRAALPLPARLEWVYVLTRPLRLLWRFVRDC